MRISDWSSDVCSSDLDNQPVPQIRHALSVKRSDDFAAWYQAVIAEADMAEESGVRGCMVIKPWGYGIWERIQRLMDDRIKAAGVQNCRSEEHTSELQSLLRISYAVFCLKKKKQK